MKFKDTEYGDLTGQTYEGNINVSELGLTSLEGAPKVVSGYFYCADNKLTSLEGAPKTVGNFDCCYNYLKSLEGAPQTVNNFDCSYNQLSSLKGAPQTVNNFDCSYNKLTSLAGVPKEVEGNFYCSENNNEYLDEEWKLRKENPKMSEEEINEKMFELTELEYYLPQEAKDIFLF